MVGLKKVETYLIMPHTDYKYLYLLDTGSDDSVDPLTNQKEVSLSEIVVCLSFHFLIVHKG